MCPAQKRCSENINSGGEDGDDAGGGGGNVIDK